MSDKTPEALLVEAAAMVVISLSERNLKDKNGSASVNVPRQYVLDLYERIEAVYPGWIESIYKGMKAAKKS